MASKEDTKKAALNIANRVRKQLGLPPVDHLYKGKPNDPSSCAITNTVYDDDLDRTNTYVRTMFGSVTATQNGTTASASFSRGSRVADFIRTFDRGGFPELIDKASDTENVV